MAVGEREEEASVTADALDPYSMGRRASTRGDHRRASMVRRGEIERGEENQSPMRGERE